MNATVEEAIAEFLADEERVLDAPTGELGYGTDLACETDILETADEVDPFSLQALAEALLRRLDCPRGALPDANDSAEAGDYGLDLRSYLNRATPAAEITALAGRIRSELAKDDRVDDVRVTLTPSPTGSEFSVKVEVLPHDPRIGGFTLTFAVTSAALLVEEIIGLGGAAVLGAGIPGGIGEVEVP